MIAVSFNIRMITIQGFIHVITRFNSGARFIDTYASRI